MKSYRFRLESVLRIRRIQSDVAKAHVAAAAAETLRREGALARRLEAYGPSGALPAPAPAPDWLAGNDVRVRRAQAVVRSHGDLLTARSVQAQRTTEWTACEQRVGALERLDDRRRDEHRLDTARAEEAEIDDVVVSRWGGDRWTA